jgi:hypothetical protein
VIEKGLKPLDARIDGSDTDGEQKMIERADTNYGR